MSKILDAIIDGVIGIINYFEHIKPRKSDDEFTAEYKQHIRTCTASVTIFVMALLFVWFARSQFENLANLKTIGAMFEGMRSIIDFTLPTILGISFLYFLYAFISFFLFYKKYFQND
jgi:hypothetical protein